MIDGQTVKTKIVTNALESKLGEGNVKKIDTHGNAVQILKSVVQAVVSMFHHENLMIFPAHNGVRVFCPVLAFVKNFSRCKLHYVVIGGWLPQFLENRTWLMKALVKFDGIYVETKTMKSALERQGLSNVYVMPNCKDLKILAEEELVLCTQEPYRLCTFSRVMREKGIEDAVNAVKTVNNALGRNVYSLDIYGQIDAGQIQWFENLQKTFPEYVCYKGTVPFDRSVEVLKEYFALLFPTYYSGEGFAGTLIDAFSAGVPVIASDWKYNAEIVNEQVGYVYPTGDQGAFTDILIQVAENPQILIDMKPACLKKAEDFSPAVIDKILLPRL